MIQTSVQRPEGQCETQADCDEESLQWRPQILNPGQTVDVERLHALQQHGQVWRVFDRLHQQLRDLVTTRFPDRALSTHEIDAHLLEILAESTLTTYGRWVYYPWSGSVVRTLPPPEFGELRLDRNRNKITAEEQQRFAQLSVGIAGLSIGNAIALTLAMEGCGHLRLADFDRLDLSNMNRLRAGVHQIGVPKTVLAARQIYEMNPYASVSLVMEGVTAHNVDRFLLEEPRLNILVDECDSIPMKFLLREQARSHCVPVLMETSDRGLLDVERYDLEPDRPVFHGLVGSMTAAELGQMSHEHRAAAVARILGPESISCRLAASMVEIDQTLSTWPQLASDVALGGATVATAARAIALGGHVPSGRRFVDLQGTMANLAPEAEAGRPAPRPPRGDAQTSPPPGSRLSKQSGWNEPIPEVIRYVVERALLAPSAANCQPWHFYYAHGTLRVVLDPVRAESLLDCRSRAAMLALGAATENIVIAAAYREYRAWLEPFPDPITPTVAAAIRLEKDFTADVAELAGPFRYLATRATNRRQGGRVPLPREVGTLLSRTATAYGAHLQLVTDPSDLDEAGRILGKGDQVRFLCRELHAEMMGEVRWTPEEAEESRDGLDIATLELSPTDRVAMQVLARPDVAAFLRERGSGRAIADFAEKAVAASSAVGILTIGEDTPEAWLRCGQAFQQVWLAATSRSLALHPWTAVPYMIAMLNGPAAETFNGHERATLRSLDTRIEQLFPKHRGEHRAVIFRLAHAPEPTARSRRFPIDYVLHAGMPPRTPSAQRA